MTDHMVDLERALDAAIDERDAARRLLLRLAHAADVAAAHEMEDTSKDVLGPLADMLGCSVWDLGDVIRRECGSAESTLPRTALPRVITRDSVTLMVPTVSAELEAIIAERDEARSALLQERDSTTHLRADYDAVRRMLELERAARADLDAQVDAVAAERDTLRRIGMQVADMIDRGYTPGHALARCLGLSLALTDREMAGAIRGLCGVQHA